MWLLLRTYLEVIALRKGPEAIPASWLVFAVSLMLLCAFWALQIAAVDDLAVRQIVTGVFGYALALTFYAAIVFLCGYARRLLPALSTIIACGAILSAVALAEAIAMAPLFGEGVAEDLGVLIWFWSVPVKGHVVARTIEQHWFVGITIVMLAFILRLGVEVAFSSPA